ncbi:alpha/beta fold hydrolase [Chlorobium sp. N1]|uniref:alpha/beta fold hydrolase n=1 Tax=Chlorobium sp. N1 TaxID=2491138 RepID=UPI0010391057|nr:alpha/beta fold hydrolase [Chlorobium sp. N1]TCD47863.1 alpha/beta fold hydrolase [Chlorobium sp. N1]
MALTWQGVNIDARNPFEGVLLLHAFPLSAAMWHPQLRALETAGVPAIAPNAWGIEGSGERDEWSFEEYADELALLMEQVGMQRATLAGLSMGGYQAFAFLRRHPERVRSLVLADTRPEPDAPEAAAARAEFISAVKEHGSEEAARRMVPNYFREGAEEELKREAEAMITAQAPEVITAAMRAIMGRPDSTPMLRSIACPTLVLCGENDRLTPPETARMMAEAIPRSTLEIIAQAAHISNLEQPEAFNRALLTHLAALGS